MNSIDLELFVKYNYVNGNHTCAGGTIYAV